MTGPFEWRFLRSRWWTPAVAKLNWSQLPTVTRSPKRSKVKKNSAVGGCGILLYSRTTAALTENDWNDWQSDVTVGPVDWCKFVLMEANK